MYSWVFTLWVRIQYCRYCVAQIVPALTIQSSFLFLQALTLWFHRKFQVHFGSPLLVLIWVLREKEYIYGKVVACAVIRLRMIRSAVSKLETQKRGW